MLETNLLEENKTSVHWWYNTYPSKNSLKKVCEMAYDGTVLTFPVFNLLSSHLVISNRLGIAATKG